jgi:hypothetical protein
LKATISTLTSIPILRATVSPRIEVTRLNKNSDLIVSGSWEQGSSYERWGIYIFERRYEKYK